MEISLDITSVAVAALEGGDHSGDGEGKQQQPDHDGDLRTFLHHFDKIPPSEMNHIEVAVEGQGDEEADTSSSVEKQHGDQRFTHWIIQAAPQALLVMVGFERKTGHQQEISNHNIEQEDTFVLPKLEPKKGSY